MNVIEEVSLLNQKNQLKEEEEKIREALKQNESDPQLWNSLGIVLSDMGRYEEAVEAYQEALTLNPDSPVILNNLGIAYKFIGKFDFAEKAYLRAIEIDPQNIPALNNYANLLRDMKEYEKAKVYYEKILSLNPNAPAIATNYAILLSDMNELKKAEEILRQVLQKYPNFQHANKALGNLYTRMGRYDEAEYYLRVSILLNPKDSESYAHLAGLLIMREPGYLREAEELLDTALRLNPNSAIAIENLGILKSILGEKEKARECFHKAYSLKPKEPKLLKQIIYHKTELTEEDGHFRELLKLKNTPQPVHNQLEILYAITEAYRKMKKDELYFESLIEANTLKRKTIKYDPEDMKKMVDTRVKVFTKEKVKGYFGYGFPTKLPVFIIGMPRSGTTLMESILDTHPDVFGAGELKALADSLREGISIDGYLFTSSEDMPERALVAPQGFFEIGRRYYNSIRKLSPQARRITDKMPGNFFNLGIILLSFSNPKVIHMKRHPLDTIVSCFEQNFAEGHEYSFDLSELFLYYNEYQRLMNHWKELFPEGFIEVHYENLVLNPERTIKEVLDYLELKYNEDCLRFYEKQRAVKTASYEQVRKPFYRTSIGKYKKYEKYLKPFYSLLSDEIKREIEIAERFI